MEKYGNGNRKHWSRYNNEADCTANGGEWLEFTNYLEKVGKSRGYDAVDINISHEKKFVFFFFFEKKKIIIFFFFILKKKNLQMKPKWFLRFYVNLKFNFPDKVKIKFAFYMQDYDKNFHFIVMILFLYVL